MKSNELKKLISDGAIEKYSHLYSDTEAQKQRFIKAIDSFTELYGDGRDLYILSVPGRSEILGNHTDHNRGLVLAGAIDKDIIAVAAKNDSGIINLKSEGYDKDSISLSDIKNPDSFKNFSSASLIAGVAAGFLNASHEIGGWDAYSTSDVLKGSGISSSAAYEVMIGNIFNHLYNGGSVANTEIAKISQFAENVYFGKPCGLMDQMACAVGGFVFMDFESPSSPVVVPIEFSLSDAGYALSIVNTGGNHADLNDDYASVPAEMKGVAALFDRQVLRGITEEEIIGKACEIRECLGDRALLRAIHFVRENKRVRGAKDALIAKDINRFFEIVKASGASSFQYLQNVYTTKNVSEQGLSLALALTDGFLDSGDGAFRVHGGGFAGTIQAYVKKEEVDSYADFMNKVLGDGAVMKLNIRPEGACRLF